MADQGFIPDQDFVPDQAPAPTLASAQMAQMPGFIPDSQFVSDEEHFGSPTELLKTGAEALARGASLGTSDIAETQLGIAKPEDVRMRRELNPVTSFVGEAVGALAPIALTEGAAAPLALGAIGKNALVGGVLGTGGLISDLALGDPQLNAQKILAHVGTGILAGAGFGALEKGIAAIPALLRGTAKEAPKAAAESAAAATVAEGAAAPIASLEEAAARLETARKYGAMNVDRPQAAELEKALSRVDLGEWTPPKAQIEAVANLEATSPWNVAREMSGKSGDTVRGIEAAQKKSALTQLDRTIDELSPGLKPTADAAEGGKRATQLFTEQYQAEKEALKPVFAALRKTTTEEIDHLPGMIDSMTKAVPGAARMFDTDAAGLVIKPYQSNWGISKSTYSAVKDAAESLKASEKHTIEDLINIRASLKQHENVLEQGAGPAQVRALGASLMDYIQGNVERTGSDLKARGILKDWAINEQQREIIEKTFGSAVGNPQFGAKAMKGVANESIGDKIFASSANVRAAKQILPPEKFKQVLSNWLAEYRNKFTTDGVFSSKRFSSWMRTNQDALNEAFGGSNTLQKIHDLNTVMRILPDATSINPSGTAKTLMAMAKQAFHSDSAFGVLKNTFGGAKSLIDQKIVQMRLNEELAGRAAQASQLKTLKSMAERVGHQITGNAKAIWGSDLPKSAVIEGAQRLTETSYNDTVDRLKKLSVDSTAMADHLSQSTIALSNTAPNITQGMQTSMTRGIQFLSSKIPGQQQTPYMMGESYKPSEAERDKFWKYVQAVDRPISVLEQVRKANLQPEAMEALQAVHPDLLQAMRSEVLIHFRPEKAKGFSFSEKSALSRFLGAPLDPNLTPQATAQNQIVYASPNLSEQATPKPTVSGMKQLNLSGRTETQTHEENEP